MESIERCFICGKPGRQLLNSHDFDCQWCDVTWSTRPPWSPYSTPGEADFHRKVIAENQRESFHFDEYVDFTKEGAPSCP